MASSCNHVEESPLRDSLGIVDNSQHIEKIIQSFDATLEAFISSDLNENELGEFFLTEAKSLGVDLIHLETELAHARVANSSNSLSTEFIQYSEVIANPIAFESDADYIRRLKYLSQDVKKSKLVIAEKQVLVDNMMFMESFVGWMGRVDDKYNPLGQIDVFGCSGWWSCWGRCAAGTAGGAILGGITGCGVGGGVGAAVGSVIPGAGTAAGAISGCAAIGLAGIIGGGLSGAAEYCH